MMHTTDWPIEVRLTEDGDRTIARVVLNTRDNQLTAEGSAHRNPVDPSVPEIGDELAVGRALVALGHELVRAAAKDIGAFGNGPVVLHE